MPRIESSALRAFLTIALAALVCAGPLAWTREVLAADPPAGQAVPPVDAAGLRVVSPGAETDDPRDAELPNFHKVDEGLYRGGQPGTGGIGRLKALGIRTILNLRYEKGLIESEGAEARAAGLQYVSVPMYGLLRPTDDQIGRVMAVLDDPKSAPVFVHCRRGADRTGAIVACYRIAHSNWTAQRAIREALDHGMLWLEYAKRAFVKNYYAKRQGRGEPLAARSLEPSAAHAELAAAGPGSAKVVPPGGEQDSPR